MSKHFHMRSKLLLLIVAVTALPAYAQEDYVFSKNPAQDISFSDSRNGWIVGRIEGTSYLWRTLDGGQSWTRIELPDDFEQIYSNGFELGWAVINEWKERNRESALWHSEDGGSTWQRVTTLSKKCPATKRLIHDFAFLDRKNGWFVGQQGNLRSLVLQTRDGGRSIEEVKALSDLQGTPLRIVTNRNNLLIVGLDFAWLSKDRGKTWEDLLRARPPVGPRNLNIESGAFITPSKVVLVGEKGAGVILTFDIQKREWAMSHSSDKTVSYTSVYFQNPKTGCAVGASRILLCTNDGAVSWVAMESLPTAEAEQARFFASIVILQSGLGWVLRPGGFLYQTTDQGVTWVPVDMTRLVTHSLLENQPKQVVFR